MRLKNFLVFVRKTDRSDGAEIIAASTVLQTESSYGAKEQSIAPSGRTDCRNEILINN